MSDKYIQSTDGTVIWASACGDVTKPACVFVHGFALFSDVFEKQYTNTEFTKHLYMIRYDLRGCGRSAVPSPLSKESFSSKRQAEDLRAVCDAFGVIKPIIAGWSLGGVAAADYLSLYGTDSIIALILMGGNPWKGMYPQVGHPHAAKLFPALISDDAQVFEEVLPKFVRSCFAPGFALPDDTRNRWMRGVASKPLNEGASVRRFLAAREQDESNMVAVKDTLPVLVVQGREDQSLRAEKIEAFMKTHFEKAEVHVLEGVGHVPFFESSERTNSLILEFVGRIYKSA